MSSAAIGDDKARKWRKLAVNFGVGMVVGGVGAWAMLALVDTDQLERLELAEIAALAVAVIYLLLGLAVLIGALSPRVGAVFLNVEDADELREERKLLLPSAVSCLALGAGLVALALAPGRLSSEFAASLFGSAVAVTVALSRTLLARADELMRDSMRESASASYYLAFALVGGWAVLAHLDFVSPPAMLAVVTLFYVSALLGSFWAAGRRGMLMPR